MTIVAGLHKREIIFLVKTKEHKEKIIGKDFSKKEKSFLVSDLIHTFPQIYSNEEKALEELANLEQFFNAKKKEFDIELIYDLLVDQYVQVNFAEVEELLLTNPQEIDRLALKQFFLSYPVYFHMNWNTHILTLRSLEDVQKSLQEQAILHQKQALEQEVQDIFLKYVKSALQGEILTPYPAVIENNIKILKDFVVLEDQSVHKKQAEKILQFLAQHFPNSFTLRGNIYYEAFKFLVLVGVFKEDENLYLLRYHIETDFTQEQKDEIFRVEEQELKVSHRKDLRDLFTFTIDGEETQDFDDALSFEKKEDGFNIYVHISDVAHYIVKSSVLDIEAQERHRTLYLVDQNIFLFPEEFSKNILALKEGKDSLAITYKFSFSSHYQLEDYSIYESLVCVDKNYSYREIDEFLEKKPNSKLFFLKELLFLSQSLQKERIEKHYGIDILLPNISPYFKQDKLTIKEYNPQKNSAFIIRELMILTNSISGHWVEQLGFPFIYLCQEPPAEELKLENRYIQDKVEFLKLGRFMTKSYMDTENIGHFALGLPYYTQITSPIRRYIDIINQRQLKQTLNHLDSLYSVEELSEQILIQESKKQVGNILENERNKYYLLKYLALYQKEKDLLGIVIKCLSDSDFLVELKETQIVCKVRYTSKKPNLWDTVTVQIHTVYPRLSLALGNIL